MADRRWMARAAKALAEVSGHLPEDFGLVPGGAWHGASTRHHRGSGGAAYHSLVEACRHEDDAELTAILALIDSGEIQ